MKVIDRIIALVLRRKLEDTKIGGTTNKAWGWLEGKKTYLMVTLGLVAVTANVMGVIDSNQLNAVLTVAGFGAGAALAQKGNRILGILKDLKLIGEPVTSNETVSPKPDA
jgi:hypothetical protein